MPKILKNPRKNEERSMKAKAKRLAERKERASYKNDDVIKALNAVGTEMSYRAAAKMFNVPKTTIFSKLKIIYPVEAAKGPPTVLTENEECRIVQWILDCAKKGRPVIMDMIKNSVRDLMLETGKENPFRNDRPGRKWEKGFLSRHPDLSIRPLKIYQWNELW